MKLNVLLFGPYADAVNDSSVQLVLPEQTDCTVRQVMAALNDQQPKLRGILDVAVLAVNCRVVLPEHLVCEQDELAVIGLVSGG